MILTRTKVRLERHICRSSYACGRKGRDGGYRGAPHPKLHLPLFSPKFKLLELEKFRLLNIGEKSLFHEF